ncbi:MAG: PID-CTERM protein-sorting domain-containing protein [Bacteroidales bacterium]
MKNSIKKIIVLFFLMVAPIVMSNVLADNPPSPGGSPVGTPIDGGVSLLIAAGAIYGAKKSKIFNINGKKKNEIC